MTEQPTSGAEFGQVDPAEAIDEADQLEQQLQTGEADPLPSKPEAPASEAAEADALEQGAEVDGSR